MRRLIFVLTIIVSVTTSLRAGQGPGAVQAPNLTIRVFGGLLGQIEGFCEPPGGTYDWGRALTADEQCDPSNGSRGSAWLGGALGVRGTLSALHPGSSDLLVVAGNNQPASFGSNVWGHIAALNPHAVGLGRADFTRLLRGATASGRVMRDWVRNSAALPLLASNVIVRRTASDLNTVKSGGVELHLPDNASVGWLTSVKIDMPALKAPTVTLEEYIGNSPTGPTTTVPATFKEGESGQDRTVEFKQPLRPARWYRLKIGDQGKERAAFTFAVAMSNSAT